MKRVAKVLAVGALAAGLLGVVGAGPASAGSGEVGYTVGLEVVDGELDCGFYSVELATGFLTQINDPSQGVECADGLTFAPDGTLYAYANPLLQGVTNAQLVTIDLSTGAQTVIGDMPPVLFGNGGMTFDGAGNLWLYGTPLGGVDPDCGQTGFESCLWQVNPADATTTFVGSTTERQVFGLAATCSEVLAIQTPVPAGLESGTEIARVDTATAALDLVVEVDDVFGPEGLDFDFAGGLWSLSQLPDVGFGPVVVSSIDLTTGAAASTTITQEGEEFLGFLAGLAISPISCPVPPTPEPVVLAPTFTG